MVIITYVDKTGDWNGARKLIVKKGDPHLHSAEESLFSVAFDLAEKAYSNSGLWKKAFDSWNKE